MYFDTLRQVAINPIFELVHDRLSVAGLRKFVSQRVVIAGGASQLQGIKSLAEDKLNKKVRLGKPINFTDSLSAALKPEMATACGLLLFATNTDFNTLFSNPIPPENIIDKPRGRWFERLFKGGH